MKVFRTRTFSEEEAREVRAIVGPIWAKIHRGRVFNVPGFRSSLNSLIQQGYGQDDISLMFGVSRERVRQYLKMIGVRSIAGQNGGRRWNDRLRRFDPIPWSVHPESTSMRARTQRLERRKAKESRRHERRQTLIKELTALGIHLGRDPRLKEVASSFGKVWQSLVSPFRDRGMTQSAALHRWFRLAGLTVSEVGGQGHLCHDPNLCRKGHVSTPADGGIPGDWMAKSGMPIPKPKSQKKRRKQKRRGR